MSILQNNPERIIAVHSKGMLLQVTLKKCGPAKYENPVHVPKYTVCACWTILCGYPTSVVFRTRRIYFVWILFQNYST